MGDATNEESLWLFGVVQLQEVLATEYWASWAGQAFPSLRKFVRGRLRVRRPGSCLLIPILRAVVASGGLFGFGLELLRPQQSTAESHELGRICDDSPSLLSNADVCN